MLKHVTTFELQGRLNAIMDRILKFLRSGVVFEEEGFAFTLQKKTLFRQSK